MSMDPVRTHSAWLPAVAVAALLVGVVATALASRPVSPPRPETAHEALPTLVATPTAVPTTAAARVVVLALPTPPASLPRVSRPILPSDVTALSEFWVEVGPPSSDSVRIPLTVGSGDTRSAVLAVPASWRSQPPSIQLYGRADPTDAPMLVARFRLKLPVKRPHEPVRMASGITEVIDQPLLRPLPSRGDTPPLLLVHPWSYEAVLIPATDIPFVLEVTVRPKPGS